MELSLKQEFDRKFSKHKGHKIPASVRLLENPVSPIALPGKISLFNHDCLHILLDWDLSLEGEAFIIGFCMGNDPKTKKIHLDIFKFCSRFVYPSEYRFTAKHLIYFDVGFHYGKSLKKKSINKIDFSSISSKSSSSIREDLGISLSDIYLMQKNIQQYYRDSLQVMSSRKGRKGSKYTKPLRISGSICAIIGGIMLASNSNISPYGFLPLAASSSQWLISSILEKDTVLAFNSASLFLFVDLLGIYRWLLA